MLRTLIVEDSEHDAELLVLELRRGGYEVSSLRVDTGEAMGRALADEWDLILADYAMPRFSGIGALRLLHQTGRDIPFIMVSGTIGEETAVEALKEGAHDFLLKDRLARLVPAVQRELREVRLRRERLAERERLVAELAQAVEARDEFLAIASHELRTPLTSLSLLHERLLQRYKELVSGAEAQAWMKERLDLIVAQTGRLQRLVNELLEVSRIAAGQLHLTLEPVDLSGVIRGIEQRLIDTFALAHARCTLEIALVDGVVGRWDRLRVEQVVENLLSNALKYGAGKPIGVTTTSDGETLTLSVQDRGMGLSPKDRDRVFGKFERAVSSQNYGGLGMGLFIVRQVVAAHGGSVDVESEPGQGARFIVRLPLAGPPNVGA